MEKKKNTQGDFFRDLARTLISVIEEKGTHLSGHSERVAGSCVNFSRMINLSKTEIDKIYLAGLFHDIGMVYIPMEILQKPDKLTDDEMAMVKQHPVVSDPHAAADRPQDKGLLRDMDEAPRRGRPPTKTLQTTLQGLARTCRYCHPGDAHDQS